MSSQPEFTQLIEVREPQAIRGFEGTDSAFARYTQGAHYFSGGQQEYSIESLHSTYPQSQRVPQSGSCGIYDAFFKTCDRWRIDHPERAVLLGLDSEGFVAEQLAAGRILNWSKDTRDRAGYVVGISLGLGTLFSEDAEAEISWLRRSRGRLLGKTPLDHMLEGSMKNLMQIADLVLEERGLGFVA